MFWKDPLIELAYKLPMLPRRQMLYLIHQGRWARLRKPQTMTEKINWRILRDRRELLAWTCDKSAAKIRVQEMCSSIRVARTYWSGTDVTEIGDVELPEHWVLKPNHRSEMIYFGQGRPDRSTLTKVTEGWLDEANYRANGEWAYSRAERLILLEELIGTPGTAPTDYKFYAFNGVTQLIQVEADRFGRGHTRSHYDADWNPVELEVALDAAGHEDKPRCLEEMLAIVGRLGAQFDFMRVDLYNIGDDIFFGEMSPYPASGHARYNPRSFDYAMGRHWELLRENA